MSCRALPQGQHLPRLDHPLRLPWAWLLLWLLVPQVQHQLGPLLPCGAVQGSLKAQLCAWSQAALLLALACPQAALLGLARLQAALLALACPQAVLLGYARHQAWLQAPCLRAAWVAGAACTAIRWLSQLHLGTLLAAGAAGICRGAFFTTEWPGTGLGIGRGGLAAGLGAGCCSNAAVIARWLAADALQIGSCEQQLLHTPQPRIAARCQQLSTYALPMRAQQCQC